MNELHEGEFKILLPEKVNNPNMQPFIMTIGPSVTMCIPIILMVLLGSRIYGSHNSFMYMTLITGGTGCLMGVLWGVANHLYKKNTYEKAVLKNAEDFERYLDESDKYLNECQRDNLNVLLNRFPDALDLLEIISKDKLFKRYKQDDNYMFVRLGLGRVPFQLRVYVSDEHNEMFSSPDKLKAQELANKYKYIEDAPIGIDLKEHKKIAIELNPSEAKTYEVILGIIVQLSYLHDPGELKIVLFYDENNVYQRSLYEAIKWLPHLFSNGYAHRYVAKDDVTVIELAQNLKALINNGSINVIIFILVDEFIRDELIYQTLINDEANNSFAVFFLKDRGRCPNCVRYFINEQTYPRLDGLKDSIVNEFSRTLAMTESVKANENEEIPDKVDFLKLFGTEQIEDVDIYALWSTQHPDQRIRAPIGITYGGRIQYLDIHEKRHGPHGLIAGTTGAGKSELIQTYLLALCISYSPEEVNFFLIDYKGGGTGCEINRLPHCVGNISNLSGGQIHRAMKAISSENKRRQTLLSNANVNHVDAYERLYREGKVDEPMPHLLLIIDEFAELKKEEPEFMSEVISLAAVGRSLGIHLILATQKPAGVVDDKIWSNSNFKLCLRVQDKTDSNDMLHRPEAAYLTNPGQCYIQIGNNEYFEKFQTGYCGGRYIAPSDKDKDIALVDESGKRFRLEENTRDIKTAYTVLRIMVDRVCEVAIKNNVKVSRSLWVDELPDEIFLNDLIKSKRIDSDAFLLGCYDDPAHQYQGSIVYEPVKNGNLAVIGGASTGKSSFIDMFIHQIRSKDAFFLINLSKENLNEYLQMASCAGVLNNLERIDFFFYHLQKAYKKYKAGDYEGRLFILVDNVAVFLKELNDKEIDVLNKLISEGVGYGIYFIFTAGAVSEIGIKLFNKIKTTIALELNDKYAYGDVMRKYHLSVYPKSNIKGRCLVNVDGEILEGQLALYKEEVSENDDSKIDSLNNLKKSDIYTWPVIKDNPTIEDFILERKDCIGQMLYLGYSLKSGLIRGVSLSYGGSFIAIEGCQGDSDDLLKLIEVELSREEYLCDDELFSVTKKELEKKKLVLIKDTVKIINRLYEDDFDELREYLEESALGKQNTLILVRFNPKNDSEIQIYRLFKNIMEYGQGICVGGMVNEQRVLQYTDLSYSEGSLKLKKDKGYLKLHEKDKSILLLIPQKEIKEEDDDYD